MKKYLSLFFCFMGVMSDINQTHATSYMEKNYSNLYTEGVTFGDIYRFRRGLIRQTRMKDSILYNCILAKAPTVVYVIGKGNWKEGEDISLTWFLSCKGVENQAVGANIYSLRKGLRDILLIKPLTFTDNTEFNPSIHRGVTIMREYLRFSLSPDQYIQYYVTFPGLFMIIRDKSGVVVDTRASWHMSGILDENATVKGILGDKWYHP